MSVVHLPSLGSAVWFCCFDVECLQDFDFGNFEFFQTLDTKATEPNSAEQISVLHLSNFSLFKCCFVA